MTRDADMSRMTWTDYVEELSGGERVIMVPIGALEQHGPHLPLATDSLIPEAICRDVAQRTEALLAPALTFGCKSVPRCGGGQHFPGTTSLDASTFIAQLKDVVREFTRHGARKIALVNGHMENQWFITEACDLALRELRSFGIAQPRIMSVGYWEFLSQETILQAFAGEFPDWSLEHAGVMETSVMLYRYPELVRMERLHNQQPARFPRYDLWPYDRAVVPETGILNTAIGATAEKGELFYQEYVHTLQDAVSEAFS